MTLTSDLEKHTDEGVKTFLVTTATATATGAVLSRQNTSSEQPPAQYGRR